MPPFQHRPDPNELALRSKNLAELVHWTLERGVALHQVEFFSRQEPYEPEGAEGSIEYANEPFARIRKG